MSEFKLKFTSIKILIYVGQNKFKQNNSNKKNKCLSFKRSLYIPFNYKIYVPADRLKHKFKKKLICISGDIIWCKCVGKYPSKNVFL